MLEPNQVFKNYKELCSYLSEPIMYGNSKVKQITRWNEYFTFHKEGHKYIISTVMYDNIDSIPEVEGHIDAIWTRHISLQLYHALAEAAKNPESYNNRYGLNNLILSNQEAFEAVGLVNEEFKQLSWYNMPNTSPTSSIIFYKAASDKLYKVLYKVLTSMHVKKVITFTDTYLLCTKKNGKTLRVATEDERSKIRSTVRSLLTGKYKHKNDTEGTLRSVNMRGLNPPFYKDLKVLLEPFEIYYSGKAHHISFQEDNLQYYGNYLLHEEEIAKSRGIVNNASYEMLKEVIDKKITTIPAAEDIRTFADKANMMPIDKSIYFELLEQTVLLKPDNYSEH